MKDLKIAIASDHAGFRTKKYLIEQLAKQGYNITDFGVDSEASADYPDYAHKVAESVNANQSQIGIVLCGSGNGVNMTVNKHKGIRSALCWNTEISRLARAHNNANICALPSRFLTEEEALHIVTVFFTTQFEAGRHLRRINKIDL